MGENSQKTEALIEAGILLQNPSPFYITLPSAAVFKVSILGEIIPVVSNQSLVLYSKTISPVSPVYLAGPIPSVPTGQVNPFLTKLLTATSAGGNLDLQVQGVGLSDPNPAFSYLDAGIDSINTSMSVTVCECSLWKEDQNADNKGR